MGFRNVGYVFKVYTKLYVCANVRMCLGICVGSYLDNIWVNVDVFGPNFQGRENQQLSIFFKVSKIQNKFVSNREQFFRLLKDKQRFIKFLKRLFERKRNLWLVWLSGLNTDLRGKRLLVQFPVRTHAWIAGQVPSREHSRGNHTLMFPSLFPSLLLPKNKYIKS